MTDDSKVKTGPVPEGYPRVSPHLFVAGAETAIEFYRAVFGATERMRIREPDGRIGHAELRIGDSLIMLAEEFPEYDAPGPRSVGGTPVAISVHVDDVDEVFDRALAARARPLRPVVDEIYGDRVGMFEDPFGHRWMVATHVEDVPLEEIARRVAASQVQGPT
ncbi:VOC family protein [Streptomyces luteolus]|uniref:VOC family protein n=1 Tax=Streptomyces luteolus TaxID=3043615 RepID=A0ABT6SVD3_9ACTN|nr:VOC family protein [Streptomyces sp. B-S-A12]MDI3419569.1 VOC family protein [Streptomyces sp. B-S-A12]